MKRTISVRAAALAAVAALGLSGLGLGAAFAVEGKDVANVSEITNDTSYSLKVHKFTPTSGSPTDVTDKNTGLPVEHNVLKGLGASPINGVNFKIQKITNIDLTTNEGWRQAEKVGKAFQASKTAETIEGQSVCGPESNAKCTLDPSGTTKPTKNDGVALFSDLTPGYYLVTEDLENSASVSVVGKPEIKKDQLVSAEPFLVAVPMTHPTELNKWVKEVNVYPKNSTTTVEKTIKDEDALGAGNDKEGSSNAGFAKSDLYYEISAGLPTGIETYKSFKIVDALDSRLTYTGNKKIDAASFVVADQVYLVNAEGNKVGVDLTLDEDYTITKASSTSQLDGRTVTAYTMSLIKPAGISKVINARNETSADTKAVKVVWKLNAKVNELSDQATIPNKGYLLPPNEDNPNWTPDKPGTPSTEVVSKYGKVIVKKTGVDAEKLIGADFELWTCNKAGELQKSVSVNNKMKWTTAGGEASFEIVGLQLNDWKNGSKREEGAIQKGDRDYYCLKETKAPSGYELLPNPVQFQLLETDPKFTKELTVKNVKKNGGPKLPVTGGQGIALLVTAGGLLVAGSVIYTVAAARKRKQQA